MKKNPYRQLRRVSYYISSSYNSVVVKNKIFYSCLIIAVIAWLLPFVCRIFFIDIPDAIGEFKIKDYESAEWRELKKVIEAFHNNDNKTSFILILKNNLKVCIINMAGGASLGIGTLFNLIFNGFITADFIATYYNSGTTIETILKTIAVR